MKKGLYLIILFIVWTILVKTVDIQFVEATSTFVGMGHLNQWFHHITGVYMDLYILTDWLGLVPFCVCLIFASLGLFQLIQRRNILKVDLDLLLLGCYYGVVVLGYLMFEVIAINYRPTLIDGRLEASYPSSTTLLVLAVMLSLIYQCNIRIRNVKIRNAISNITKMFMTFMVLCRLISGVHWLTDIIGAILLSLGLFELYKGMVKHGVWEKITGVKKK